MNKELSPLEALCYLDDIAHGRKMAFDPHELKLIIEKSLKALEIIKKYITLNKSGNAYYICLNDEQELISKEDYNLLKEVLSDAK